MHNFCKGSSWYKWDLHVHTPCSIEQCYGGDTVAVWEKYIKDLENLPPEFSVLGINDYWFLDGYKKVLQFKREGRLRNIDAIFPVCEFRIKKFAGVDFQKLKRINLHVIFSPELDPALIEAQFLNTIQSAYCLEAGIQESSWSGTVTKDSLIALGKTIKENTPPGKASPLPGDLDLGFNNLNVDEEKIITQLNTNGFLKGKNLITIGKTEWADLKWTEATITEKKDIINKVHFVFTCANSVEEYKRAKEGLTQQNVRDLLLDCSDAHNFSDKKDGEENLIRERIGNALTWIKAEPTFEGLRQILHEPIHRLQINDTTPREPIRKIEKIKFNFPEKIQIQKKGSVSQDLCIGSVADEIFFSPYFTCLIGGRGTGKSTIINLIAERLGQQTDFFDETQNSLLLNNTTKRYDIKNDPSSFIEVFGANDIEFVSQGKIEKLTEGEELTHLIFTERIIEPDNELKVKSEELYSIIELVKDQISLIQQIEKVETNLSAKQKDVEGYQNVVDSINDPNYLEITTQISALAKEKAGIEASRNKYLSLLSRIQGIIQETKINEETDNEYEERVSEIIDQLLNIDELKADNAIITVDPNSYELTDGRKTEIEDHLHAQNLLLIQFFTDRGTSEENIRDSQNANESIAHLKQQILELEAQRNLKQSQKIENQLRIDSLKELADTVEAKILGSIKDLNSKLEIKNENVSKIRYEFHFNKEYYREELFNDFNEQFKSYHKTSVSWDSVKQVLFLVDPNEEILRLSFDEFYEKLETALDIGKYNRATLYVSLLLEIFNTPVNFRIYQQLIIKHIYNWFDYLSIVGYYGKRTLQQCSFGQKCTAVIVTLLMTGVKPLVIDEPEAHLDNRLIADYLVDLIKEKKIDRQIIFATHNANFVVNGDAELIHILEVPDDESYTRITSTTIENILHRDKLLKLEGGKDAFEKRERKLL